MLKRLRDLLVRPRPYAVKHLRRREIFRPDYEILAASLLARLDFDSVLDIGCANGFLLSAFQRAGKEVRGVELSPYVHEILPPELAERVSVGDFSTPLGRFDLACCVEVAEHIPPERSRELVASVTAAGRSWIYFTAAPPGQSGHGHINCRLHDEWLAWFGEAGWQADMQATELLRQDLTGIERAVWLPGNSFLFTPGA